MKTVGLFTGFLAKFVQSQKKKKLQKLKIGIFKSYYLLQKRVDYRRFNNAS